MLKFVCFASAFASGLYSHAQLADLLWEDRHINLILILDPLSLRFEGRLCGSFRLTLEHHGGDGCHSFVKHVIEASSTTILYGIYL